MNTVIYLIAALVGFKLGEKYFPDKKSYKIGIAALFAVVAGGVYGYASGYYQARECLKEPTCFIAEMAKISPEIGLLLEGSPELTQKFMSGYAEGMSNSNVDPTEIGVKLFASLNPVLQRADDSTIYALMDAQWSFDKSLCDNDLSIADSFLTQSHADINMLSPKTKLLFEKSIAAKSLAFNNGVNGSPYIPLSEAENERIATEIFVNNPEARFTKAELTTDFSKLSTADKCLLTIKIYRSLLRVPKSDGVSYYKHAMLG